MTGFDSVIHGLCSPRSGMVTVPDTHLSHQPIANRNFLGARFQQKAKDLVAGLKPMALTFA
jgi:ABC-type lipopolysaccharide export system ATPase subunit